MNCKVVKSPATGNCAPVTCQERPASTLVARCSTGVLPFSVVARAKPIVEFTKTGSDTRSAAGTGAPRLSEDPPPRPPPPEPPEPPEPDPPEPEPPPLTSRRVGRGCET